MRMIRSSGRPAILRQSAVRLVVVGVDGDQQLLGRKRELLGDQRPGQLDRALLEVVAEREVAEHLEEGVVARGVADVVQVVVLAAGAHALLRRGRPRRGRLLGAGEDVLERHHAGVDEKQAGVVLRHQRRGWLHRVPGRLEVVQEQRAELVERGAGHRRALAGQAGLLNRACLKGARRPPANILSLGLLKRRVVPCSSSPLGPSLSRPRRSVPLPPSAAPVRSTGWDGGDHSALRDRGGLQGAAAGAATRSMRRSRWVTAWRAVHPCCGNLGGGGFMLIHEATGKDTPSISASRRPSRHARCIMFLDRQGNVHPRRHDRRGDQGGRGPRALCPG